MARPIKTGLDYFPLDVTFNDDKVDLVQAKYGVAGFGIIIRLWQKIYRNGYYIEWNDEKALLFALREVSVDINLVNDIINDSLRWEIFNLRLFNEFNILTSHGIQKRFVKAIERRKKIQILRRFCLIENEVDLTFEVIDDINEVNVNINSINTVFSTQRKEKKSKVKEKEIHTSNSDEFNEPDSDESCEIDLTEKPKNASRKELDYILDQFNAIVTDLPKASNLTDGRKRIIRARLKEYSFEQIIDVFKKTQGSDFLTGKVKNWKADFNWILKAENFVKILEGSYENNTAGKKTLMEPMSEARTQAYIDATPEFAEELWANLPGPDDGEG